jgi:hypothetical protein
VGAAAYYRAILILRGNFMATALIMFSVFVTGAIACHKDAGASNTLMVLAMAALATALGMWSYQHFYPV